MSLIRVCCYIRACQNTTPAPMSLGTFNKNLFWLSGHPTIFIVDYRSRDALLLSCQLLGKSCLQDHAERYGSFRVGGVR